MISAHQEVSITQDMTLDSSGLPGCFRMDDSKHWQILVNFNATFCEKVSIRHYIPLWDPFAGKMGESFNELRVLHQQKTAITTS